jgi:hypothetical protein
MTFSKVGDVFSPELLDDALKGMFAGMMVMKKSGAAIVKVGMPAGKAKLGEKVIVPYFGTVGELEDLAADGDALTPKSLATTEEEATVQHSGIALEATVWASLSGVEDPYMEGGRQIMVAVERRADKALIDVAIASGTGLLTLDVYSAGTPRTIDYDLVVDGKMKWNDEQDDIACMVIHSKVKGDMLKLKDSTGRPLFVDGNQGELDRFCGIPVLVSDRLAASSDSPAKYTTLLLKKGSLIFWLGEVNSDEDKDILANTRVTATHLYWAAHRYKRHPTGTLCGVVRIYHN